MNMSQDLIDEPHLNQKSSQNLDEVNLLKKKIEELEQELVYNQN